ncbi:MAG: cryptochrome/photolyase family protein [Rhodoglobus sp.]
MQRTRLTFVGQLGELFDDGGPILLIEARSVFARRRMHRAKAHLILSALRHRAKQLGSRAEFHQVDGYASVVQGRDDLEVINPTSYKARRFVRSHPIRVLPSRGFVSSEEEFTRWAASRGSRRLLLEDFYRDVRMRTGILMEGSTPAGGQWNYDHDNRQPPPKGAASLGLAEPWWPVEDDIDHGVREDLDRWQAEGLVDLVGSDGPRRFAVTGAEAEAVLNDFVVHRLGNFGPFEDATLSNDWTMAHSLLSVPLNLGVLDPRHAVDTVAAEYASGRAPLASVEGFVRQVAGWRDYVWHLYWHLGEAYRYRNNFLDARKDLPREFYELDAAGIEANCLSHAIAGVDRYGWVHHIQRLMIIGNWALQRGYDPGQLDRWFTDMFVDGTPWVMPANVIGMSQHADGGLVATKPYASGGAYLNRMSDHCGGCRFDPKVRLGDNACPYTAGYWAFLDRVEPMLTKNYRMAQPLAGLRRLSDREEVIRQEAQREGL